MENDTAFTLTLKQGMIKRLEDGLLESPFQNRVEFIRYLLDAALTDWERSNA